MTQLPTDPVFTGTRLTTEDERLREDRARLHRYGLVRREHATDAPSSPTRWRAGPWSFIPRDRRDALLTRMLPERPPGGAWTEEAIDEVEAELVPARLVRRSAALAGAFCDTLGIPSVGGIYLGARVLRRDGDGVTLALRAKGSPLHLMVDAPSSARAFARSRRFALTYSVGGRALFDDERELMNTIARDLSRLDPVGAEP